MSATAIILARAGSKGLPGKNTADVAGRPCIAWTIDAALEAELVERVCVSSDDPRALEIGAGAGAEAVERPPELAHDTATVDGAARHAHTALGEPDGPVVILYANVPARAEGLVDDAVGVLIQSGAHSVQSYALVGKNHPWWTVRVDDATGVVSAWEGGVLNHGVHRRQDLPPAYIPDGGVIAVIPDALHLRLGPYTTDPPGPHDFFGHDRRAVLTEPGDVIDIDGPVDLVIADTVLRRRGAGGAGSKAAWRRAHR